MTACTVQFGTWGVTRQHAGGELPVPGVYGVPEQWPHIATLYQRAGFAHTGHTEIVYLARVQDLPSPAGPPVPGLEVRRSVGINGCRLSAVLGQEVIGYIEVETLEEGERRSRHAGWADVGNLHVGRPTAAAASGPGCSGRPPTGWAWPKSACCSTTPGWKAPTPAGTATTTTGPSCPPSASAS